MLDSHLNKEACKSLNTYLDNKEFRNEEAQKSLNWMSNHLIYEDKMIEMTEYMDKLVMETRAVKDTDKFKEIVGWIKSAGGLSKDEIITKLQWGRGIKWTPYRRALMNHPNIFDVNDKEPRYFWREE